MKNFEKDQIAQIVFSYHKLDKSGRFNLFIDLMKNYFGEKEFKKQLQEFENFISNKTKNAIK